MKQGDGTLALNTGVADLSESPEIVEFDGFINYGSKVSSEDHVIRRELTDGNSLAEGVRPTGTINFGAGVSQIDNLTGFFEITEGNSMSDFQSEAKEDTKKFPLKVRAGSQIQDAEIELKEPWVFGKRLEVEESVQEILALTPQVGHDTTEDKGATDALFAVVPQIVGGGVESEKRLINSNVSTPADTYYPSRDAALVKLKKATPAALAELSPEAEPFSTFSLHVSDVSFQLAKAALASGTWPEADKIRIEEFVNAFDYGDPMPAIEDRVSCRIDQAAHPFLQQRNLVRIALRTAEGGRAAATPMRLTLLLDSSGSMERPDRRESLTRAFTTLASQLQPNDEITLIAFARQPRLLADAVPGSEAMKLNNLVSELPSEGGTNLEAALQLAAEKAGERRTEGTQSRVVLLTDGAANLGDANAESLAQRIEVMRDSGIAFDAAGFGADGLNDEILEALTRKGDGRYYLLDKPEDAD